MTIIRLLTRRYARNISCRIRELCSDTAVPFWFPTNVSRSWASNEAIDSSIVCWFVPTCVSRFSELSSTFKGGSTPGPWHSRRCGSLTMLPSKISVRSKPQICAVLDPQTCRPSHAHSATQRSPASGITYETILRRRRPKTLRRDSAGNLGWKTR